MGRLLFISYSSKDLEMAREFRTQLSRIFPVWMAPESIPIGSDYSVQIPRAIAEAIGVVFLLTENSAQSVWVKRELDTAITAHVPIFPVKIQSCDYSQLKFFLSTCQIIDASEDFSSAILQIQKAVESTSRTIDASLIDFNKLENKMTNIASNDSMTTWEYEYRNKILTRLDLHNKIFTLLDIEYLGNNNDDFISMDDLLLEYDAYEDKQLDEETLIQQSCRFVVHGNAGCGKTTLLRKLCYQIALRMGEDAIFPVFLELKNIRFGTLQNLTAIYEEVVKLLGHPLDYEKFLEPIKFKKLICFLDGYDEARLDHKDEGELLQKEIETFSKQSNCSVVISTRSDNLPTLLEFNFVVINPLKPRQVLDCVDKYLKHFHKKITADEFVDSLPEGIRAILNSPLLVCMVVTIYTSGKHRPENKDQLYEQIIRRLLSNKSLLSDKICPVNEKFIIVSKVAFEMLLTGKASMPFNAYMDVLIRAIEITEINVGAPELSDDLMHSRILELDNGHVSFFHTSIMEYLSRCEINREYNFESKANMDQYFLKNNEKIAKIISCLSPNSLDNIIEVGAGIGTVSLSLPTYKSLTLVDLDEGLCKILRYNFRNHNNVFVLEKNAIEVLKEAKYNKVISNLPYFLTDEVLSVLEDREIDCAVMSIKSDADISFFSRTFLITEVEILEENDFFPRQPFKSRVVKLIRKHSKHDPI